MKNIQGTTETMTLERYEIKFTIPLELVDPISNFIAPYCSLDIHSLASANNGYYKVNSIYFDSPSCLFLKNRLQRVENRFNMRVRCYGNKPQPPYFLEVKQKRGQIVRKYRTKVIDHDWPNYFSATSFPNNIIFQESLQEKNRRIFERLVYTYNAEPKILTQYIRRAWVSDIDYYARVTFDIDLRFTEKEDYNFIADKEDFVSYDFETIYDRCCNVILELKCNATQVPLWMLDLIKKFGLRRRSFSKYAFSTAELHNRRGFTILPRMPAL